MNIKSINKLSALICGLTLLPLTLLAQNQIITTSTTEVGPISYHDVENNSALNVSGNGVIYEGTDITLTATYNTTYADPPSTLAHGTYVTDQATLSLTNGTLSTTGSWGHGVLADSSSTLTLTDGTITTGNYSAYGIYLFGSTGTLNNVNIETKGQFGDGVHAEYSSTLTLIGGTITTGNNRDAYGIYLYNNSTGTVRDVNIKTTGENSHGVTTSFSTLTLTGGTITTVSNGAYGIYLYYNSTGTVSNVNIKTTGKWAYGVSAISSSTLTLIGSDINATDNDSDAIYISNYSTGTASLNHNTLTGNITTEVSSTLTLSGSNGTIITGNINAIADYYDKDTGSTINITLNGSETKLIGTATHDAYSAINLTIENGTQLNQLTGNINTLTLQNGATLSSDDSNGALLLNGASSAVTTDQLILSDGTLIDYNDKSLSLTGTLTIGNGILIDFSNATLEDNQAYTILDWSNADLTVTVNVESFTAKNLTPDMTGTFTVANNQLTFNAIAIPEPSVYILLGIGLALLLLTARRRNVQS